MKKTVSIVTTLPISAILAGAYSVVSGAQDEVRHVYFPVKLTEHLFELNANGGGYPVVEL